MSSADGSREIDEAIKRMESGAHSILVYDTVEHKRDVLISHLKQGVGNEGLVYGYSGENPEAVKEAMAKRGLDPDELMGRGELTIADAEEVYLRGGRADVDGIQRGFAELAWAYRKRGYKGVRAGADMAPFLRKGLVRELGLYERSLGRKFSFPGKGICAYGVVEMQNSGQLESLMPLFLAHGTVILTGPNGSVVQAPEEVGRMGLPQIVKMVMPRWRVAARPAQTAGSGWTGF